MIYVFTKINFRCKVAPNGYAALSL